MNNKPNTAGKPAKKQKKKRKKKKHPVLFTVFLVLFCLFTVCVLTGIVVGTSVLSYVDSFVNGKIVIDLDNYKNSQSQTSIMYAYDENDNAVEQLRLHGEENRIWLSYDQMPENLLWAFVCLEDKRFYEHDGVDWIRTIGVMINPAYEGQGGSTITQQLIKNLTDQKEVTYIRKFNEILRALNFEKYYSKKDILEAYLNTVYLGAGCYGVKTAAETYFGKEAKDLNLAECAMLAGITQAPYSYNPYVSLEKAVSRQKTCLNAMLKEGKITENQYNKALKTEIKLVEQSDSNDDSTTESKQIMSWYEEYVIDQVIADLQSEYGYEYNEAWRMVYYGGLSIYSAVDLDIQEQLEDIYENRSGFPYASVDSRGNLPESSMTIMDYSGRIVALVGGTGEKTDNRAYNRATDYRAKRQPGSSIKPLSVYAPAIDLGLITASSPILEKASIVDGNLWPRNFNGDYGSGGYITVKEALVRSLNTVPVRILKEMLSLKNSLDYCNNRFHLNLSENDMTYSALAVGGSYTGVTTLEMASAFAVFGNGGKYYKPYSYFKVLDRNGEVLLDNTDNEPEQAIKPETAKSMLSMLTSAVTQSNGTGYGSKISGFQTFAKTGTTSDNCDKWYCGGTPYYVTAVWYGYDYRANLYTGTSNPAKTIFKYVFSKIHSGLESKTFDDIYKDVDDIEGDADVTTGLAEEVESAEDTTAVTASTTAKTTAESSTTQKATEADTTKKTTQSTTQSTTKAAKETTTKAPPVTVPSSEAPTSTTVKPTEPSTQPSTKAAEPSEKATEAVPVVDE
ncbi:MAG: transglycosylase domain-containing protein [Acutalibacteraceae bacterium]